MLIKEAGRFKVVLMDQQDAKETMKQMMQKRGPQDKKDFYLMSSTGKVIIQNASQNLDKEQWNNNPQLTIITKLFTRQFSFNKKEINYLASLEPNQQKLYFDFFQNEVAKCRPQVAPILAKLQTQVEEQKLAVEHRTRQAAKKENQITSIATNKNFFFDNKGKAEDETAPDHKYTP